jgi:hypothetical protein
MTLLTPKLTAEEKKHTAEMQLHPGDPKKGKETDRIANHGTTMAVPGGLSKTTGDPERE